MRAALRHVNRPAGDAVEIKIEDDDALRQGARMIERLDAGAGVLMLTDADLSIGEFGIATRMVQPEGRRGPQLDEPAAQVEPGATAYLQGELVQPTVLVDVPEDSAAIQEETFGPTVTVTRVATMDEAIEKANGTRYALGSTVFSKEHGMAIAERLRAGMTAINGVISFAGIPTLPFGGVGDSGFGRIHGEDGLKEFTRSKAITRQRFALPSNLMSFRRPANAADQLARVIGMVHGYGAQDAFHVGLMIPFAEGFVE